VTVGDGPEFVGSPADVTRIVDRLIAPFLSQAMSELDDVEELLAGMGRYHLGLVDRDFNPLPAGENGNGKRMRPAIALLCCAAAGGQMETAASLATAIELLHNFTLIHDDIQDQSAIRRHRPTVWSIWGVAQAINAGDALFAAAHRALYALAGAGVAAELVLELAAEFDRMTIAIVAGQVRDLDFERRREVAPAEYLQMIDWKTAAIVRYAAWAGARIAGAGSAQAELFGAFGGALGLGFQIQDDLLGVWGAADQTGKVTGDDIRRKKQSLPVLLLQSLLSGSEAAELDALYEQPELDAKAVSRVLKLLEQYAVRPKVEEHVSRYHDLSRHALAEAVGLRTSPARIALVALIDSLALRTA
jgi:geranylgeranyl diphosphate synthase, type I